MSKGKKRRTGIAMLVLALVSVLAVVPAVNAAKRKRDKPVDIVKQSNAPIPTASTGGGPPVSGKVTSQITVTKKKKWSIRDVNIDLHITVPPGSNTDDLRVLVRGPNGAVAHLISFTGTTDGVGFGTSCNGGSTLFDDQAPKIFFSDVPFDPATDDPNQIEFTSFPPYAEKVEPFASLSRFKGEKVKGTWTLTVINFSTTETATLNCWSVHAKPQKPRGTRA